MEDARDIGKRGGYHAFHVCCTNGLQLKLSFITCRNVIRNRWCRKARAIFFSSAATTTVECVTSAHNYDNTS